MAAAREAAAAARVGWWAQDVEEGFLAAGLPPLPRALADEAAAAAISCGSVPPTTVGSLLQVRYPPPLITR